MQFSPVSRAYIKSVGLTVDIAHGMDVHSSLNQPVLLTSGSPSVGFFSPWALHHEIAQRLLAYDR